jgi:hypothetical protein
MVVIVMMEVASAEPLLMVAVVVTSGPVVSQCHLGSICLRDYYGCSGPLATMSAPLPAQWSWSGLLSRVVEAVFVDDGYPTWN